jgi:hypothetical protein
MSLPVFVAAAATAPKWPLAIWIDSTPMHRFMQENPAAFTACETLHFMGLTILIGALMIIDLRGLGLFKRMPFGEVHKLVPFAIGAFIVQLATGVCFVFQGPQPYFDNLSFRVKMVLVLLAGINALVFEVLVFRPYKAGDIAVETAPITRFTCLASILMWFGVLMAGRLIPYIQ